MHRYEARPRLRLRHRSLPAYLMHICTSAPPLHRRRMSHSCSPARATAASRWCCTRLSARPGRKQASTRPTPSHDNDRHLFLLVAALAAAAARKQQQQRRRMTRRRASHIDVIRPVLFLAPPRICARPEQTQSHWSQP
ncbi:hypothetical protein GY45DRAFT_775098 [Cubamyces sp. BRFM 1775]|nr:hypothetical protein GY45DRAFT_775098 [Cubamyces sp. BRFM 1775]